MAKERRAFFVDVAFRPGDKVKFGPHEALVSKICISTIGLTYELLWWNENVQNVGTAYEIEIDLIEAVTE